MSDSASETQGVIASIRAAAALALEILETRLALLSTELEEQSVRLARVVLLSAAALLCVAAAVVLAVVAVVVCFWDTHRLAVLLVLAGCALAAAGLLAWQIRRSLLAMPALVSATLETLRKDRARLQR
jgi:uncharacterized membrane protein YqjE